MQKELNKQRLAEKRRKAEKSQKQDLSSPLSSAPRHVSAFLESFLMTR